MTTPTPSSVSLAEEIFRSLEAGPHLTDCDDLSGPQSARFVARRKEELTNDFAEIIQRRVESLERQRDEAVSLLKQCQGCVAAGIAIAQASGNADLFEKLQTDVKSFLARLKEGR